MYADHITVSQKRIKAVCWVMHSLPHTNIWHSTARLASVTCTACDAGLQQSQRNWGKMRHQWRWKQVKTKLIKSTDAVCVCLYVCVNPLPSLSAHLPAISSSCLLLPRHEECFVSVNWSHPPPPSSCLLLLLLSRCACALIPETRCIFHMYGK